MGATGTHRLHARARGQPRRGERGASGTHLSVAPFVRAPYYIALVHNGLSQQDEALDWLERAYEERDVRMVFLGVDPAWDALRGLPRFTSLLKQMNLSK